MQPHWGSAIEKKRRASMSKHIPGPQSSTELGEHAGTKGVDLAL